MAISNGVMQDVPHIDDVKNEFMKNDSITIKADEINLSSTSQSPINGTNPIVTTPNPLLTSFHLHRSLHNPPHPVSSTSGIYIHLQDGRKIIDACGGAAVTCIGHNNPEVLASVITQMQQLSYVHTMTYTTTSSEELAHHLLADQPYGLERAYFVGSGSEAMDAALKLARQYFYEQGQLQRTHFVARRQAYHGNTVGAMSVGSNLPRKITYDGVLTLPNVSWVSPAYHYQYSRPEESEESFCQRLLDELDTHFLQVGPEKVIAFIAEPLVGATSACTPAPAGYFKGVRAICDKYGILLILDEVMSGTGRTGTFFAFEQEDIVPDLLTMGKGLGGGYCPIAAVLAHKKVIDVLKAGTGSYNHGHTYQAHPVSCAAALAVQKIIRRDGLLENCTRMGKFLYDLLSESLAEYKVVGQIRGRGLFWGIEFVKNQYKTGRKSFDPKVKFGTRVQQRAFDLGVAVYPGAGTVDGTKGDHVIVAPPYNVTEEECLEIVRVLRRAIDEVSEEVDREDVTMGN